MRRTAALLVAGAFVLAACADDDQEIRATPQAAPTSTEAPPSAAPAALPSAIPVSTSPTALGNRALARIDISIGPDWLAAGAGSIWVRTDSGDVVRIDPPTNTVAARIPVAGPAVENLCQGLGADDTAVWSCAPDGDVVRIDPATNRIAATVSVGKFSDQGHLPLAFGHLWLLTGDGSTLVGLAHDAVDVTVDLGTRCNDLAATATSLWASCLTGDQVVQVDPVAHQVISRVTGLDTARLVAAAGGRVWVTFLGGLAQIDEATGAVKTLTQVYVGPQAGLFADPDGLWVRDQGLFLTRVDPSGHVVGQLSVPEQSGGSVLIAFGSLWATAYDDEVLYRVAL
jgi:streptogramin lyase